MEPNNTKDDWLMIGYSFVCKVSSLPPVSQLFASSQRNHLKMSWTARSFWLSMQSETFWTLSRNCQNLTTSYAERLVVVSVSKHKRGPWKREFLSSGSPQGLSSLMLVVIFLSRHCSLLCSPFLFILSAIYQTMKSERKKKWTCRFFALWLMSSFLRKKNVLLFFCAGKKRLLSAGTIQDLIFVSFWFFAFSDKRFSVVYCPERSQSQCISVDPVSVMYVCLTTLRNLSPDGI